MGLPVKRNSRWYPTSNPAVPALGNTTKGKWQGPWPCEQAPNLVKGLREQTKANSTTGLVKAESVKQEDQMKVREVML